MEISVEVLGAAFGVAVFLWLYLIHSWMDLTNRRLKAIEERLNWLKGFCESLDRQMEHHLEWAKVVSPKSNGEAAQSEVCDVGNPETAA